MYKPVIIAGFLFSLKYFFIPVLNIFKTPEYPSISSLNNIIEISMLVKTTGTIVNANKPIAR